MSVIAVLSLIPYASFYIRFALVYIPAFVVIVYLLYCMLRYCFHSIKCTKKKTAWEQEPTTSNVNCTSQPDPYSPLLVPATSSTVALNESGYVLDDLFADWVMNPSGYEEKHTQYGSVDEAEPLSTRSELWTAPAMITTCTNTFLNININLVLLYYTLYFLFFHLYGEFIILV